MRAGIVGLISVASVALLTTWSSGAAARCSFWTNPPSAPQKTASVRTIWIFKSAYAGENASRAAVAGAFADAQVEVLDLPANLETASAADFASLPRPDLIIHSFPLHGENAFLARLKIQISPTPFLVNIGKPRTHRDQIDLIVLAQHYDPLPELAEQTLRPLGQPSRVRPESLHAAHSKWDSVLSALPKPIISLLIGGPASQTQFSNEVAVALGQRVKALAKQAGGSVVITNSSRTPPAAMQALLEQMSGVPFLFHDVKTEEENPYLGFLAHSNFVVVTGDSGSMMSDAASTGLPLYIFAPEPILEIQHRRLILQLIDSGRARILGDTLENWSYRPLNVATEIQLAIERRMNCRQQLSVPQ